MLSQFTYYCVAFVSILAQMASSSDVVASHSASSPGAVGEISRRLATLATRDQKEFSNSTSLNKSLDSVTLFKKESEADGPQSGQSETQVQTGIEITCNTCYLKGEASARLKLGNSFNVSDTLQSVEEAVTGVIDNVTSWIEDIDIDWSEAELDIPPPPEINFDVELPEMPEAVLEFQLDDTELYVDLSTTFSGGITYSLPLYQQGLGIDLDELLFLGFFFSVDLILSVEDEVAINHGFHIKLDDEVVLKIAMFSKEATDLSFNGGQFEFLPVEVETGSTVIRAVLQLSLRAGFELEVDLLPGPEVELGSFNTENFNGAVGLETEVYVNVADFKTNMTVSDEDDCDLRIQQAFQFAVGAAAGAYVGIGEKTWGPRPETEIPMFPTTFADECITRSTAEPKTTGGIDARAPQDDDGELTTTTLTREATYTAVECGEKGAIYCPAHKETYKEHVATETLVTSVLSGSEAAWPETVTAVSTKSFGESAVPITTSSGKPEPDNSKSGDDGEGFFDQSTGGVSNKLIVGVSVGVGVPVLVCLIACIILCCRRKKPKEPEYDTTYVTVSTVRRK